MRTAQLLEDQISWPAPGHYVVAVSGGVDSMALLHLLAEAAEEKDLRLRVAHLNHDIRSDAYLDADLVRQAARVYHLPFHTDVAQLERPTEELAREARYAFLNSVREEYGADGIITAHHWDDAQETHIFNLLRGSGRHGASPLKNSPSITRPLLGVRKADLRAYAERNHLPWREDSTNTDLGITRNFIRHELLPTARLNLEGFDDAYGRLLEQSDSLNRHLDGIFADNLFSYGGQNQDAIWINRSAVRQLSVPVLCQLFAFMIRKLSPGVQLHQSTLADLALLTKTGRAGSHKSIAGVLNAIFTYDTVTITLGKPKKEALSPQILEPGRSAQFGNYTLSLQTSKPSQDRNMCLRVRPGQYNVRSVLPGDRVKPDGFHGTKKLQDVFINAKIDRDKRRQWPVVTNESNEVIWVPGLVTAQAAAPPSARSSSYYITCEEI